MIQCGCNQLRIVSTVHCLFLHPFIPFPTYSNLYGLAQLVLTMRPEQAQQTSAASTFLHSQATNTLKCHYWSKLPVCTRVSYSAIVHGSLHFEQSERICTGGLQLFVNLRICVACISQMCNLPVAYFAKFACCLWLKPATQLKRCSTGSCSQHLTSIL